jgi:histidinol-phosphate aminotransferase
MVRKDAEHFLNRGFTRRHLGRIAAVVAGGAAMRFASEPALAQMSALGGVMPAGAVKINANENPLGPCAEAAEAIYAVVKDGGRYRYDESFRFARAMAAQEGVGGDNIMAFGGSSDPLHRAVLAFGSPDRAVIAADPGYEAAPAVARYIGAKAIGIPLTKAYAHDVRAMAAADANAGLFYICNPNNPTGSVTPRADIEWLVENKPKGSVVLVDEAYIHFSHSAKSCVDLVAAGKDVIVLRTFSKLFGMAGLRAGVAMARPDLLDRIGRWGANIMPVAGMVGAHASIQVKDLVPQRRKINADIRNDVLEFLEKKGFAFVPTESNKFMVDVKRPGAEVVRAMAAEKVFIGRVWSSMPTHVRVTVGTKEDMSAFKTAFLKVTA